MIGWAASVNPPSAVDWIAATVPADAIVYRCNSLINQLVAARAGLGLAVQPCYLADGERSLLRLFAPLEDLKTELWLIMHESLKGTARIRAFMDSVGDALARERPLLEGETD